MDMKRLGIGTSRVGMSKEGEGTEVYKLNQMIIVMLCLSERGRAGLQ